MLPALQDTGNSAQQLHPETMDITGKPEQKRKQELGSYVTASPALAAGTEYTDLLCAQACSVRKATAHGEPQATKLSVYYRHNSRHNLDHGFK